MPNDKSLRVRICLPVVLLLFLLVAPLIAQTCSAQPTQPQQNKAISFLRDVLQLDVDHYKFTLTANNLNLDTLYLTYNIDSNSFLSLEKSQTLYFQFQNDTLTSFNVQPGSDCLAYTQPRSDGFNEVLGVLERYRIWLNDPQVGEMVALLRQVGSEQSTFQASGNLSLRIQLYSNTGEYRFSNYLNGAEYSGISLTQSGTGSIFFTDNRASQAIGDTTIGISEDQARAIALDYIATHPFRVTTPTSPDSAEITDLNITGVKSVTLKSGQRNSALYPYYDVQFNAENPTSSSISSCGVNIGANDGEIWSSYSGFSSTNTLPVSNYNILVIVIVSVLVCAAVIIGVYESRLRFNVNPKTV